VVVASTDVVGSTVGVVVGCVVVCSDVVATVVVVCIVVVVATTLRSTQYAISDEMYSIRSSKFRRKSANSYAIAENKFHSFTLSLFLLCISNSYMDLF